jgi:hypothetical protein
MILNGGADHHTEVRADQGWHLQSTSVMTSVLERCEVHGTGKEYKEYKFKAQCASVRDGRMTLNLLYGLAQVRDSNARGEAIYRTRC